MQVGLCPHTGTNDVIRTAWFLAGNSKPGGINHVGEGCVCYSEPWLTTKPTSANLAIIQLEL
ncbi:hypothetical protein C5167_050165, partial [Papaver somniferum]